MKSFLSTIQTRLLKLDKNFLAICVGGTGTGKSWAMMRIAELLDPEFNIDRVVFSSDQFKELLNSGKLKTGSFIVWDEAGAGVGSREALTKENRHTTKIAQTFRHENYGLLFTVPDMSFIDVQIRTLSHIMFKPITIDRWNKKTLLDIYRMTNNEKLNKTYIKPFYIRKNGERVMVSGYWVKAPSLKLRKDYEIRKKEFTDNLNRTELNPQKIVEAKKGPNIKKIVKKVLAKKDEYLREWHGRLVVPEEAISFDYNIGGKFAKQVKFAVEREVNNG